MVIKDRLFPYPVMCMDTDDYTDGSFMVDTTIVEQGLNNIKLRFDFNLNNPGLRSLITQGKAAYAIHLECSTTSFRTVIESYGGRIDYNLMNSKVNGEVAVLGMIVAKEKIPFYHNEWLNEDYKDIDIIIQKGSILAYENLQPIRIAKEIEELAEKDSIFSIVKKVRNDINEDHPIEFNLSGDHIQILVNEMIYDSYIRYRGNVSMRPLMNSLLIVPALTYMMEVLRKDPDDYLTYASTYWFMKIEKTYKLNNLNFMEDVVKDEEKFITAIVQEMLKLPINQAMMELPVILSENGNR